MPFWWRWLALASALAAGFGLLWLLNEGEPCCPEPPIGTNVEGDGRTAWLLGHTLLTIPKGMTGALTETRTASPRRIAVEGAALARRFR